MAAAVARGGRLRARPLLRLWLLQVLLGWRQLPCRGQVLPTEQDKVLRGG